MAATAIVGGTAAGDVESKGRKTDTPSDLFPVKGLDGQNQERETGHNVHSAHVSTHICKSATKKKKIKNQKPRLESENKR